MKLGMIQGRLLRPEDGGMQEFPVCWEEEFDKANKLGLNHIEWIVTSRSFSYNPIFSRDCSGFSISSLCADNLVDDRFLDDRFLNENLDPICKAALDNKVMWITIPLLENSSISDPEKRKIFKEKILIYGDKYQNLNFSFEAETTAENALDIAKERDNFWLTYDTGNITSERIEHKDYITKTQEKISNVHLKDRKKMWLFFNFGCISRYKYSKKESINIIIMLANKATKVELNAIPRLSVIGPILPATAISA